MPQVMKQNDVDGVDNQIIIPHGMIKRGHQSYQGLLHKLHKINDHWKEGTGLCGSYEQINILNEDSYKDKHVATERLAPESPSSILQ